MIFVNMNLMILLNIAKTVTLVNWVVSAYVVILVIQVNLVIGEYDILWDSGESGDPGEFGDSGYFYEPADFCESDYFSKTVNSVDS